MSFQFPFMVGSEEGKGSKKKKKKEEGKIMTWKENFSGVMVRISGADGDLMIVGK